MRGRISGAIFVALITIMAGPSAATEWFKHTTTQGCVFYLPSKRSQAHDWKGSVCKAGEPISGKGTLIQKGSPSPDYDYYWMGTLKDGVQDGYFKWCVVQGGQPQSCCDMCPEYKMGCEVGDDGTLGSCVPHQQNAKTANASSPPPQKSITRTVTEADPAGPSCNEIIGRFAGDISSTCSDVPSDGPEFYDCDVWLQKRYAQIFNSHPQCQANAEDARANLENGLSQSQSRCQEMGGYNCGEGAYSGSNVGMVEQAMQRAMQSGMRQRTITEAIASPTPHPVTAAAAAASGKATGAANAAQKPQQTTAKAAQAANAGKQPAPDKRGPQIAGASNVNASPSVKATDASVNTQALRDCMNRNNGREQAVSDPNECLKKPKKAEEAKPLTKGQQLALAHQKKSEEDSALIAKMQEETRRKQAEAATRAAAGGKASSATGGKGAAPVADGQHATSNAGGKPNGSNASATGNNSGQQANLNAGEGAASAGCQTSDIDQQLAQATQHYATQVVRQMEALLWALDAKIARLGFCQGMQSQIASLQSTRNSTKRTCDQTSTQPCQPRL